MIHPLVAAQNVSKSYDSGKITALCDATLSVSPSEYVVLTGPSGSGKSTLMHILGGLDFPSSGRVFFGGKTPAGKGEWSRLRALHIGFVFQSFNLLPTLTASENIQAAMFGVMRSKKARREKALELLSRVGLTDRIHHYPNELSGGERQRVAIARSLANSPDLILADEPTGSLDSGSSVKIMNLLREINENYKTTVIVVSHDPEIARNADRIVHIVDGRIV